MEAVPFGHTTMLELLTSDEIGKLIGRTGRTVRTIAQAHGIAAVKCNGRQYLWTQGDVLRFREAAKSHKVGRPRKDAKR